jgi:stress-induced morphogen
MFQPEAIHGLILKALPDAKIQVKDLTGGGDHFEVEVVSSAFKGKTMIDQHRMNYAAIGDAMDGPIHALKIKTLAYDG